MQNNRLLLFNAICNFDLFLIIWWYLQHQCSATFIGPSATSHYNVNFISKRRCFSSDSLKTRSLANISATTSLGELPTSLPNSSDFKLEVLSTDPLVYTAANILSPTECRAYIKRAASSPDLVRSNAPAAGVDVSRLWPLPLLVFGSAIPSALRVIGEESTSSSSVVDYTLLLTIIKAALFPMGIASLLAIGLVILANNLAKGYAESYARTSSAVSFNQVCDLEFIQPLMERVCNLTGHDWYKWEAPVVTRYRPGECFGMHNDASPTGGSEWLDDGGQRVVTVITYLNTVPIGYGGQTRFDRLKCDLYDGRQQSSGIDVHPVAGTSCIFFPADADTCEMDDRTRHESVAMVETMGNIESENDFDGEKWIVQLFGRKNRVPSPLGICDEFQNVI
mmetsp:Transcript_11355/g.17035  ORF Transcript_11355/g.17035 Transcript_11355/m.17035 type:complete len:393 (-) Transcript_11355:100-1278(-)